MEGLLSWGGGGAYKRYKKIVSKLKLKLLIKNKLRVRLTKRVIKIHFPFNGL